MQIPRGSPLYSQVQGIRPQPQRTRLLSSAGPAPHDSEEGGIPLFTPPLIIISH